MKRRAVFIGAGAVVAVVAFVVVLILLIILMIGGAQQKLKMQQSSLSCVVGGLTAADGSLAIPLMGRVTSDYGPRPNPFGPGYIPPGYTSEAPLLFHGGVDIGGIPEGTPINAVMGGTVIGTNMEGEEGGNILKIDSGNGIEWRYVHIANGTTVVKPGQQVKAGDHLAGAGETGVATGVHLHLMLYVNGERSNPQTWLAERGLILEKGQMPRLTSPAGGDAAGAASSSSAAASSSSAPSAKLASGSSPAGAAASDGQPPKVNGPVRITLPEGSEWTLSPEQVENAALIIGVARELNISDKGIQVALMTGLQETMLQNMANPTLPESMNFPHQKTGTNKDSVNVFQQRTVAGWGSVPELMNPEYAARAFFGGPTGPNKGMPPGLLDIPGWEGMAPGSAAQAVQNSRHPDEYNKWENAANQILGQVTGTTPMMCQGAGGAAAAASATSSTAPEGNHALDEDTKRLEIPADFSRSKIVSRAEAGIGGTYTYGAAEFRSWDASGLVSRVYQDNGIDMPRQAPWTVGKRTETPQPGDIVAQKWDPTRGRWEHVGIYVGDGMMISAINESAGTRKYPVTQTGTDTVYFDVIQEKK